MSAKGQMRALKTQIDNVKVERLGIKLQIEQEGLRGDRIDLDKARISTQIKQANLNTERFKLQAATINTEIAQIGVEAARNKLSYARTDLFLTQQEYAAKLQIKSMNIQELLSEVQGSIGINSKVFGG